MTDFPDTYRDWMRVGDGINTDLIFDPRIAAYHGGGGICPEQHWGQLVTGEFFYLRYRHGKASLVLGTHPDIACWWENESTGSAAITVSEENDGVFETNDQFRETVIKLLDQIWTERESNPNYDEGWAKERAAFREEWKIKDAN